MAFKGSATSVVARLFRLLSPTGQVLMELANNIAGLWPGFLFKHNNATYADSWLYWTQGGLSTTQQTIQLKGPQRTGGAVGTLDIVSDNSLGATGYVELEQVGVSNDSGTVTALSTATLAGARIAASNITGTSYARMTVSSTGAATPAGNIFVGNINTFAGTNIDISNTAFTLTTTTVSITGTVTITGNATVTGTLTVNTNESLAGYLSITGASDASGNIRFSASNPYIVAPSYIYIPGGAYFNSGTVYVQASLKARGGVTNDVGTTILDAGSTGFIQVNHGAGLIWASSNSTASVTGMLAIYRRSSDGVMFYFTSRREVKTRIKTITNPGATLDKLHPVSFYERNNPKRYPQETVEEFKERKRLEGEWRKHDRQYGFIADEVAAADQWLASYDTDPKTGEIRANGWKIYDVVALLVAEVQELRTRVTQLEQGN